MSGWLEMVNLHEGTGTDNYEGTAGREMRAESAGSKGTNGRLD